MGETKVDDRSRAKSAPSAEVIEGFIKDAIAVSEPQVPYSEGDLRLATGRLIGWYMTENTDLDRSVVFASKTIDAFIARGLPTYSEGSRSNIRAQLRRMGEVFSGTTRVPQRLTAAEPTAPYSPKEIVRLGAWAKKQANEELTSDAYALVALGLGAGLSAVEIGEVRAEHVHTDQLGTRVQVTGERTRAVQVLRLHEEALTTRATAAKPGAFLIRPQRKTNPRNFVTNLVDRSTRPEWGPQSQQMRATWLVEHMSTGTPVAVLLEAAGLQSLDALARYMRFVAPVTSASARIQLRG